MYPEVQHGGQPPPQQGYYPPGGQPPPQQGYYPSGGQQGVAYYPQAPPQQDMSG